MILEFKNPVFDKSDYYDEYTTVRHGSKWLKAWIENGEKPFEVDVQDGKKAEICGVKFFTFLNIDEESLELNHDPDCRNYEGLLTALENCYPEFYEDDYVTVVHFKLK